MNTKVDKTAQRRRAWLLGGTALLALLVVGCIGVTPVTTSSLPDVEGTWSYEAFDIKVVGRTQPGECRITGVTLYLGPWRSEGFNGRSQGGVIECTEGLSDLSAPLPSYPVRRGGSVLDFIAFDIGSPDWRHDGKIGADTMGGRFWIQEPAYRLEGRFKATVIELVRTQ